MALDTVAGVRREMGRLYRMSLNGKLPSDELTRLVYVLKEIRACLESELLSDVQRRLALLSQDLNMDNLNGYHLVHRPAPSSN